MKDIISQCETNVNSLPTSPSLLAGFSEAELEQESSDCMHEIDRQMETLEVYRAANKGRQFTAEYKAVEEKYHKRVMELFEGMVAVQAVRADRERWAFMPDENVAPQTRA